LPQRQVLVQAQRSPQVQRSAAAPAHPQDDFAQRHIDWVWGLVGSLMASLLVSAPLDCVASPRKTQPPPGHYTRRRERGRHL